MHVSDSCLMCLLTAVTVTAMDDGTVCQCVWRAGGNWECAIIPFKALVIVV